MENSMYQRVPTSEYYDALSNEECGSQTRRINKAWESLGPKIKPQRCT